MPISEAVDLAIDTCIHNGILKEFLERNRKEVRAVSIYEFDEKKFLIMVTRRGIIKRISLNAYNTARKGGLIAL